MIIKESGSAERSFENIRRKGRGKVWNRKNWNISFWRLNDMLHSLLFTGKSIVYNYYESAMNIATMNLCLSGCFSFFDIWPSQEKNSTKFCKPCLGECKVCHMYWKKNKISYYAGKDVMKWVKKYSACASSPWCCYQPKEPEAARRKFLGNKEQDDAKR